MSILQPPCESNSLIISVVVCTYNRSNLLDNVLQTLCTQALNPLFYEIIIVDNNSKDHTAEVASEFCSRYPNVCYYLEKQQGLSYARNLGWQKAQGAYVAYIDDDCKAPREWLSVAKDVIGRFSPAAFGGPSFAFYDTPKPYWYKDCYASHEPYKKARILKNVECFNIYGHNMFFRRTILQKFDGFNVNLGMSGNKIAYGEETVLLKFISSNMPKEIIYYDPRLYVYHLVLSKKMTMHWIIRSSFSHGRYSCYFSNKALVDNIPKINQYLKILQRVVLTLWKLVVSLGWEVFFRPKDKYPYIQNYLYEHTLSNIYRLGMFYEHSKQIVLSPDAARQKPIKS